MKLISKNEKQYAIPGVQVLKVFSDVMGREFRLFIQLPLGYFSATNKNKYPVVYLLDAQWHYSLFHSIYNNLVYDVAVSDAILVGITWGGDGDADANKYRLNDLLDIKVPGINEIAGSENFSAFLSEEVFPFMESSFRVGFQRFLVGASTSAQFVLHTLAKNPPMFNGYIALCPAPLLKEHLIEMFNGVYSVGGRPSSIRLFLAIGSCEDCREFNTFADYLNNNSPEWLESKSVIVEGVHHSGLLPEGFVRGLQFLFEKPKVIISDIVLDMYVGEYEGVEDKAVRLAVWKENGSLVTTFDGKNKVTLSCFGPRLFAVPRQPIEARFSYYSVDKKIALDLIMNLNRIRLTKKSSAQFYKKLICCPFTEMD